MRGKHYTGSDAEFDYRITPAHAGKTDALKASRSSIADHPRTCGENTPDPLLLE